MIPQVLLALSLLTQAPAKQAPPLIAAPQTQAELKAQHQADMKKAVEKKKQAQQKKAGQRTAKAKLDYQQQQGQREYEAKMAPIIAQQQARQDKLAIEAQKADALSSMANAAQRGAQTDAQRLRLQSQALGVPQVMTPNGYVPSPYGLPQTVYPYP
jgi:hypothetical protein